MAENSQTNEMFNHDLEVSFDQQASTSKAGHNPELVSYNTQDLKVLQYNSADDVRQSMKKVVAEIGKDAGDVNSKQPHYKTQSSSHGNKRAKSTNNKNNPVDKTKKRGRPPVAKAGPSTRRTNKQQIITKMYEGKLANLVKFRSRYTDSDY